MIGVISMKVKSFTVKIDENEAQRLVKKQMGILSKLMTRNAEKVTIKTIFIENKIITLEVTNQPPPLLGRFMKKNPHKSRMQMIANGSTCGVSHYDHRGLSIEEMDVNEGQLQLSDYPDHQLIIRANALARRILRRRIGGNVTFETLSVESVFRPYHVAFFGELTEGTKVRYIPIPADNNMVRKTF